MVCWWSLFNALWLLLHHSKCPYFTSCPYCTILHNLITLPKTPIWPPHLMINYWTSYYYSNPINHPRPVVAFWNIGLSCIVYNVHTVHTPIHCTYSDSFIGLIIICVKQAFATPKIFATISIHVNLIYILQINYWVLNLG